MTLRLDETPASEDTAECPVSSTAAENNIGQYGRVGVLEKRLCFLLISFVTWQFHTYTRDILITSTHRTHVPSFNTYPPTPSLLVLLLLVNPFLPTTRFHPVKLPTPCQ